MPPGLPHSIAPKTRSGFLTRSNDMWERYRGTPEEQQLWDLLTESERNECPSRFLMGHLEHLNMFSPLEELETTPRSYIIRT
ncbi:hypothetical protein CDCA_CDCA07G2056 [Cyanidium caldarium]|uniref:Uncharacterized protein n=1 Tax=Cyanidium caldarium TaxID=2771 RepID=A0AAV9IV47_CYACA|nr:hypothetical protein CDCA_CDCA07G2056 [Cyanidium caldarium]